LNCLLSDPGMTRAELLCRGISHSRQITNRESGFRRVEVLQKPTYRW
jgi:hypothetical protein